MAQGIRLVLFGPPGAGKGTQANLLKDQLQVVHISPGDLFRRNHQEQTPLGLRAAWHMDQGLLVPDEITIDIVLNTVLCGHTEDGFIMDGFPRNLSQAHALQEALMCQSWGLDKVVHIDVPEPELVQRLGGRFNCSQCQAPYNLEHSQSGHGNGGASESGAHRCTQCGGELYQRVDDSPEAVQRRLEVYRNETAPVLDFYRERGLLVDVPGSESIKAVNQRMLAVLNLEHLRENNRPVELD